MTKPLPRGIRACNPGNIREAPGDKTKWVDERATDDDPIFEEFNTPVGGLRALGRTLIVYQVKHGLRTIAQIISRWAPPNENDTAAYIAAVAKAVGVKPDAVVNVQEHGIMAPLLRAIVRHENGSPKPYGYPPNWYADDIYDEAMRRLGIVGKPAPIAKEPEAVGGTAALATSVLGTAGPYIPVVKDYVRPDSIAGKALGLLVVLAVAYLLVRLIRRRKVQSS